MTALQTLAERSGIEAAFRDARGEMRQTSVDTKQALMGATGLQAGDEGQE